MLNTQMEITPVPKGEVDELIMSRSFEKPNMKEAEVRERYALSKTELREICRLYKVEIKGMGKHKVSNTIYMPRFELAFRNYTRDLKAHNEKEAQYMSL